jgi:hypothetical protein
MSKETGKRCVWHVLAGLAAVLLVTSTAHAQTPARAQHHHDHGRRRRLVQHQRLSPGHDG